MTLEVQAVKAWAPCLLNHTGIPVKGLLLLKGCF